MDKITKEIEEMAEKMEKSVTDPKEKLQAVIKSLGKEGLKAKMATLSDDEKVVLKAALEEMTLKKAVTFDDAYVAPTINGKVMDTIIQEEIASDDADEKLMKPAAAAMAHQGTPTEGWSGQVIKALEDNLDEVIEKAMEKCKDDKMVMKKLKEKGMDEGKVQGALDKYKAKKDGVKKSEEVVEDLEKGKNPFAKKDDEKKENKKDDEGKEKDPKKPFEKKEMKKSVSWDDEQRLLKANTQGRNFHFNVEQFIEETIKNEPKETVAKSEGSKENVNDLIQKGEDRNWTQVNTERNNAAHSTNGHLYKSFEDEALAEAMGMTVEQMYKILG